MPKFRQEIFSGKIENRFITTSIYRPCWFLSVRHVVGSFNQQSVSTPTKPPSVAQWYKTDHVHLFLPLSLGPNQSPSSQWAALLVKNTKALYPLSLELLAPIPNYCMRQKRRVVPTYLPNQELQRPLHFLSLQFNNSNSYSQQVHNNSVRLMHDLRLIALNSTSIPGPEEPVRLLRFWPDQYLKLQQYIFN